MNDSGISFVFIRRGKRGGRPAEHYSRGAAPRPVTGGRQGQALVEASLVIALLSMILLGMLQLSRMAAARALVDHAAAAGARARAVGFNEFMVQKVVRVATIPSAGRIREPRVQRGTALADWLAARRPGRLWHGATAAGLPVYSPQQALEQSRIPMYLAAPEGGRLTAILDYEDWNTRAAIHAGPVAGTVRVRVSQRLPLRTAMHRAFYASDELRLEGESVMEDYGNRFLR